MIVSRRNFLRLAVGAVCFRRSITSWRRNACLHKGMC